MTTEIVILQPGIATSVQDLGRRGYRVYGVPQSGALDPEALQLANAVVGNAGNVAALEMLYSGVAFEARGGSIRVAVGGAQAIVERASEAQRHVPQWQSCTVHDGARLRVGVIRQSAAAYLAVEGGFAIVPVMGSLSTYARTHLGGWHGRTLQPRDALPLRLRDVSARSERRLSLLPAYGIPGVLRVLPGPHAERFSPRSRDDLVANEYTVASASDRSGLRLSGPALQHIDGYDLPSEGIPPGSIQVPGSGLPVILIGDHPTVGGYPRIATIISADLAAAGRLRIGARVRFGYVTPEEAAHAREARERELRALTESVVDV
jgi:biotin-dependent carboxylase-like uncharacterized protein